MPENKKQIEDARRQGQFEGRVEEKLNFIQNSLGAIDKTTSGLDTRLRNIEDSKSGVDEKFNDVSEKFKAFDKLHETFTNDLNSLSETVTNLVKYQSTVKGIVIVLGILSTIVSPIITTLILRSIFKS